MGGSTVDCVIAGAGCAGLSLAVRLVSSPGWDGQILMLDARSDYERDRTWCFWDAASHPFEAAVAHSWDQWSVRRDGRTVSCRSDTFRYQYLPADRFYAEALNILESAPGVEIRLGTPVDAVVQDPDGGAIVRSTAGDVRAGIAFDSRYGFDRWPGAAAGRATGSAGPPVFDDGILLQHFAGAVVQLEEDAFDPETALLMDFDVDQGPGIHFVYVLPFDRRTALVEDTWLSPVPFSAGEYHERIADYIGERYGSDSFYVLHAERGAIPMAEPAPRDHEPDVVPIGVRGGLARPSSGYAFLAIQRHSEALARWLTGGRRGRPPRPYSGRAVFLDRVFVSYIRGHPDAAPDMFVRMFDGVRPDAMVRFMSDSGSPADDLRVMASLPALPLMREALRTRGRAPKHGGR